MRPRVGRTRMLQEKAVDQQEDKSVKEHQLGAK